MSNVRTDTVTVKFSSTPESFDEFYEEVLRLCPDVAEDKQELQKSLVKKKKLSLWWD